MKRFALLATCVAAVLLGACAEESKLPQASGDANVRAINTIASSPDFAFRIEERVLGSVSYKASSSPSRWDDLDYTFNFDVLLAGQSAVSRVASVPLSLEANKDYTFVLSGAVAAPTVTLWETDEREWDETATDFEALFAHTAASLGNVDIYFADAATAPVLGSQLATLDFGEVAAGVDIAAGEYVLSVTPAGDDTTLLFQSDPVTLPAQAQIMITVFDGDANDLAPVVGRAYNMGAGGTVSLNDNRFPPVAQFYHASLNAGPVDIYIDDPLTAPFVSGHVFGDITPALTVPVGTLPITYTPENNMGMLTIDTDLIVVTGLTNSFLLIRDNAGEDALLSTILDRRSIETQVRFSIFNSVEATPAISVYLVPTGESIDEAFPTAIAAIAAPPIQFPIDAGDYDLYLTPFDSTTPLAGPIPISAALGDVIDTIIYENPDPAIVDVVFTSGPTP